MKISIPFLSLAIGALVFASGCTKKSTSNNKPVEKPKVEDPAQAGKLQVNAGTREKRTSGPETKPAPVEQPPVDDPAKNKGKPGDTEGNQPKPSPAPIVLDSKQNNADGAPQVTAGPATGTATQTQVVGAAPVATVSSVTAAAAKPVVSATPPSVTSSNIEENEACFEKTVKGFLNDLKSTQTDNEIEAYDLFGMKYEAAEACKITDVESISLKLTNKMIELAKVQFPNSPESYKFFTETEAKKMDIKDREKAYENFEPPPAKTATAGAKVDSTSVVQIEKCFSDFSIRRLDEVKKTKENVLPLDILDVKAAALKACPIQTIAKNPENDLAKIETGMTEKLIKVAQAKFPKSEESIKFFAATEGKKLSADEKKKIYEVYKVSPAVQTKAAPTMAAADVDKAKAEIMEFEKCITREITQYLVGVKKEKEVILPKDLYVIKYGSLNSCKDKHKNVDSKIERLDELMTMKVLTMANAQFPKSMTSFKFFAENESKKMEMDARKKVYENYASVDTVAPNAAAPVPAKPAGAAVAAPAKTAASAPVTPATSAPAKPAVASSKPPVAAVSTTTTNSQSSAPATAKPVAAPAVDSLGAEYEKCTIEFVKENIGKFKSDKKSEVSPKDLADIKKGSSEFCGRSQGNNQKLDSRIVDKIIELAKADYPKSTDALAFFKETENKKIDNDAKNKLYDSFVPVPKTPGKSGVAAGTVAKADAKQNEATTTGTGMAKDPFCASEQSKTFLNLIGEKGIGLGSPTQLSAIKKVILSTCSNKDEALINKSIADVALEKFPASKKVVEFYLTVEKRNIKEEEKTLLYSKFTIGVEIQSNKVRFQGPIEPAQTTGNIVTYSIANYTGVEDIKIRTGAREGSNRKTELNQTPKSDIHFVFDFNLKGKGVGTLTIMNGQNSLPLEFGLLSGTLEEFKSGKPAVVTLSPESWLKVLKAKLEKVIVTDLKDQSPADFIYSVDDTQGSVKIRTCNLTTTTLECVDPDTKIRASINPDIILKAK